MTQPGTSLMGDADTPWRVAYADEVQGLEPSALNRTVLVVAVNDLAQVLPQIARSRIYLQTVGLAAAPAGRRHPHLRAGRHDLARSRLAPRRTL